MLDRAIITAVKNDDVIVAAALLAKNANVNARDPENGLNLLMYAACHANVEMTDLLLNNGADVFTSDPVIGNTPLHKCCQGGSIEVAKLLISAGAHVNAIATTTGHTPVMDALWYKWPDLVVYLLDQNVCIEYPTNYNFTIWDHVNFEEKANTIGKERFAVVIERLHEYQKGQQSMIASQTLMAAVLKNDLAGTRAAIKNGADVNALSPLTNTFQDGHTPLLVAARDGSTEIVRELLAAGANVRVEDYTFHGSPVHKATYNGNLAILRMLVDVADVDINFAGPLNGYTALHDAIWHGWTDCVNLLLDTKGVRLDIRGHDGKRPVDLAMAIYGAESEMVAKIKAAMVQ